jgi:hypothetical protein
LSTSSTCVSSLKICIASVSLLMKFIHFCNMQKLMGRITSESGLQSARITWRSPL